MRGAAAGTAWALLAAALGVALWKLAITEKQRMQLAAEAAGLRQETRLAQRQLQVVQAELAELRQQNTRSEAELARSNAALAMVGDEAGTLIRSDLMVASAMKVAIAEYYATMGRLPARQSDAGLPPPSHYRGKSLTSATLLPDGNIELVFDAASGVDGGRIRFEADLSHVDAMGVQWHCRSADYPRIAEIAPGCIHMPRDAAEVSR